MHAAKTKTLTAPSTPDELFAAAARVVEGDKFTVVARDDAARSMAFTSGKSALSWGREYLLQVVPDGDGSTLTVVCGGLDDAPTALLDGWKHGKAATKLVESIEAALAGPSGE
jgi:hypothetical protein